MGTFYMRFDHTDGQHACIIEDDGTVAYAYLLRRNEVVADLWLYNQAPTPSYPEWKDRSKMPFLNSKEYVDMLRMAHPIISTEEVTIHWIDGSPAVAIQLSLSLHGQLYGLLASGTKPGWTIAASKDGPLARVLIK